MELSKKHFDKLERESAPEKIERRITTELVEAINSASTVKQAVDLQSTVVIAECLLEASAILDGEMDRKRYFKVQELWLKADYETAMQELRAAF